MGQWKLIFEKNGGLGFWGWTKHADLIFQKEEIEILYHILIIILSNIQI